MNEQAKKTATVLEFHLSAAFDLIEKLEDYERVAIEDGHAKVVGRSSWKRTEFDDRLLERALTVHGQRKLLKKRLWSALKALRRTDSPRRSSAAEGHGTMTAGASASAPSL